MKLAMPTSRPTFWAEDSVSIGTYRSKLRVSHQTPLRFTQFWQIPFFPGWFYPLGLKGHSRYRGFTLGLRVISQVFQVGIVGGLPIGAPRLGDACRRLA